MPILDKNLLIDRIEERLNDFVPANTVRRILEEISAEMTGFDVSAIPDGVDQDGEDLVALFINAKECEGKSKKTIERYEYILRGLQKAVGVPLKDVTVYHLRQFLMSEKERGIAPGTIDGKRSIYSSFYGWLHDEGLIRKNPTANLAPVKRPKEIKHPFSAVEIKKLRDNTTNLRDAALVEFLLSTGCRVSEVCSVNRSDIDFKQQKLIVNGKGSKQRTVYLDDVTCMVLQNYLRTRKDFSPALFIGKGSDRLTADGIRRALNTIAEKAGVEGVHPHRFRRTLATNLIDHGMSIQEVAAILGHDKLDTTMTYVYVNQRNVETAYRRYA